MKLEQSEEGVLMLYPTLGCIAGSDCTREGNGRKDLFICFIGLFGSLKKMMKNEEKVDVTSSDMCPT